MDIQFSRIKLLVGEAGCARLADSHVVLAGYGAVGSFAAEALVRSGIGHLRIIDADRYELSNINRQLGADVDSVGHVKVEVGYEHLKRVNPNIELECIESYVTGESEVLLRPFSDGQKPEIYVDAIDTLDVKVSILSRMHCAGLKIFSSMGAARRFDMSQVRFGDISKTEVCPLAREVRKRLRRMGIESGIGCVYSTELAQSGSHVSCGDPKGVVVRPQLGSLVTVTGCFGLRLASECIRYILDEVR